MDIIFQPIEQVIQHILDANKRLFWGYLASTILLCWFVYSRQRSGNKASNKNFIHYLFPKKIWLHASAKLDYWVWLINIVIKFIVITPLLFSTAKIAISTSQWLSIYVADISPLTSSALIIISSYTLLVFFLDDFSRFLLHYLMHKIPLLWRFHQVHHSAEVMTPITVYRVHPVESLLYALRLSLIQGIALGIGFYLFGHKLSLFDVLGANVFVFIFNMFGANLRHSHVWLSWWSPVEKWFISPAQHQIHHSIQQAHYDKNFGSALAVWDRLFGTLVCSNNIEPLKSFGLEKNHMKSIVQIYSTPFWKRK